MVNNSGATQGRGGNGNYAVAVKNRKSIMMTRLPREEFVPRIQERLMALDVRNYPNDHQMLKYPEIQASLWYATRREIAE
jgi:hypothetical protein